MRWPKGPPHLALNSLLFIFFLGGGCFFSFFAFHKKKKVPPKKGHFGFIVECLPLFFLSLFCLPFFTFSFSVSLLLFFSCFLSAIVGFILVPCVCLFLCFSFFVAFVSWKEQHQNVKLERFVSSILFLFWVSCFVCLSNPFFLSLLFSWFKVVLVVQHQCFWFWKQQVEKHQLLVKTGVATKTFFEPVFH